MNFKIIQSFYLYICTYVHVYLYIVLINLSKFIRVFQGLDVGVTDDSHYVSLDASAMERRSIGLFLLVARKDWW